MPISIRRASHPSTDQFGNGFMLSNLAQRAGLYRKPSTGNGYKGLPLAK